jgi:hypothetical protein
MPPKYTPGNLDTMTLVTIRGGVAKPARVVEELPPTAVAGTTQHEQHEQEK